MRQRVVPSETATDDRIAQLVHLKTLEFIVAILEIVPERHDAVASTLTGTAAGLLDAMWQERHTGHGIEEARRAWMTLFDVLMPQIAADTGQGGSSATH